jgi:hypothetical protein
MVSYDLEAGLVEVEMTFEDRTEKHTYPILNHMNKPIENPTAFDINNAQMRAFAKLFSMMTGFGLSLYTGEDLTQYEAPAPKKVNLLEELKQVAMMKQVSQKEIEEKIGKELTELSDVEIRSLIEKMK